MKQNNTATVQTAQHTPGPWIASGSQILQGGYLKEWRLEIASLPSRADPNPKLDAAAKNHSERNANARLIAAAPELLEALQALCDPESAWLPLFHPAFQQAKDAIAKATA